MRTVIRDLLDVLPIPSKGVLLVVIGITALFCCWLDLKGGRGFMRVAVLALVGLFALACGVALLIIPLGAAAQ